MTVPRGTPGWPERTGPTPSTGLCYCPEGTYELHRYDRGIGCSRCSGIFSIYEPPAAPNPEYLAKRKAMREAVAERKLKAREQNGPQRKAAA